MTKSELIQIIADRQEISLGDATLAVTSILDAIANTISEQRRVEIRGFGVFGVTYREARKAHNPANGTPVDVPGKFVPRFKPGKDLSRKINSSDE
jgi:integration host factor subunit beta